MSELSELLDSIDIQDYLETEGIDYRNGGTQYVVKECPVCGDSRWKVYLNRETGLGLCFHGDCMARFNLFTFARHHIGGDTRATILHFENYARGAGIAPVAPKRVCEVVAPSEWKLPSSTPLPTTGGQTHSYLTDRKITLQTQAMFELRFCNEGSYQFTEDGRNRVTDFSQRIILPVRDLDGEVKTFQGRDVTGDADKRYLFPSSLPGTGRFLYGGSYCRGKEHLVIGEGPFDVMAIHQAIDGMSEFHNTGTVGSFGLSIGSGDSEGDDQLGRLRLLKRKDGTTKLTFLWDGEHGAFKQALEAGYKLRAEGFDVRIGMLPADKDPNQVDTEIVRRAIREAFKLSDQNYMLYSLRNPYKKS